MLADTGALTTVLDLFLDVFRMGQRGVALQAGGLLTTLATMELLLASFGWILTGRDALVGIIRRLLTIGFFIFVVQNYDSLLHTIIEGFIQTGKTAASPAASSINFVRDPSTIVDAGYVVVMPIFEHLKSYSGMDVVTHLHDIVITGLCAIGLVFAYFIIAIQVFVTYLEFAIVSTLGLILVPFGVFKHTAFMAEKVFGAIISFGVKLMVLGLLVSVTVPVLQTYTVPPDASWKQLFDLCLICFAVAALAWHAPGVAAGLLAGGPSLTAGTAAGTAVAAAAGGAAVPHVAHTTATSTFQSAANTVRTGTMLGAGALGVASGGAMATSAKLGSAGFSRPARIGGALGGAAFALTADGVKTALRPMQRIGSEAAATYKNKQQSAPGFARYRRAKADAANSTSNLPRSGGSSGQPSGASQSTSAQNAAPAQSKEAKKPRNDYPQIKKALQLAKQSVPSPSRPAGGVTAPIKHNGDE